MKIWHISDTHTYHDLLKVPYDIDMIIHSGDCSNPRDPYNNEPEVRDFIDWFKMIPVKYKIYVAGNHDCYHKDTLFLTENGWFKYEEINDGTKLATFDKEKNITYEDFFRRFKGYCEYLYDINGVNTRQIVTNNHNVWVDSRFVKAESITDNSLNSNSFWISGNTNYTEEIIEDYEVELINFIISDGTIVFKQNKNGKYVSRIQFKLSKENKINRLKKLLEENKINFTFREATRSGLNKLQPYYICIYGNYARKYCDMIENKKEIPDFFTKLSNRQKKIFINYFSYTDGYESNTGSITIHTINKKDALKIAHICCTCGYDCQIKEKNNGSGFKNGKIQYVISVMKNRANGNGKKVSVKKVKYNDDVVCFSVPSKKLITMYDGRIAFSGNTSIEKKFVTKKDFEEAGIIYLENESVTIEGIKIFGSPHTPNFGNWAFMKERAKLERFWRLAIDEDVDIVVTHGPPKGVLDKSYDQRNNIESCGDKSLLNRILEVQPAYCLFGHIHNCKDIINAGVQKLSICDTWFSNGSVVTDGRFGKLSSYGNIIEI